MARNVPQRLALALAFLAPLYLQCRSQYDLQPFFIVRNALPQELQPAWNDKGSGADSSFSSWNFVNKVTPEVPFRQFGSFGCAKSYDAKTCLDKFGPFVVGVPGFVSSSAIPSVGTLFSALPATPTWTDKGSGSNVDGSVWRGVAPQFYDSVGDIFAAGKQKDQTGNSFYVQPDLNATWAVWKECLELCTQTYANYKPTKLWSDNGSGADKDVSIYSVGVKGTPSYLGVFRSQVGYGSPESQMCVKAQCIKRAQIYTTLLNRIFPDKNDIQNAKAIIDTGIATTFSNPANVTIVSTDELVWNKQETTTATTSTKLSYSSSVKTYAEVSVEENFEVNVGVEKSGGSITETAGVEYSFQTGGEKYWSDTSQYVSGRSVKKTVSFTLPPRTWIKSWVEARVVNNAVIPFSAEYMVQVLDYSTGYDTFLSDQDAVLSFLQAAGFTGEKLAWFAANQTMKVRISGEVKINQMYTYDIVTACLKPGSLAEVQCPGVIEFEVVENMGTFKTLNAASQTAKAKFRVKGYKSSARGEATRYRLKGHVAKKKGLTWEDEEIYGHRPLTVPSNVCT